MCYLAFLNHWGFQRSRLLGFFQNRCSPNNSLFHILARSLILSVIAFLISFLYPILKISAFHFHSVLNLFKQKTIYRHCWKHTKTNKMNVTNISMITLLRCVLSKLCRYQLFFFFFNNPGSEVKSLSTQQHCTALLWVGRAVTKFISPFKLPCHGS